MQAEFLAGGRAELDAALKRRLRKALYASEPSAGQWVRLSSDVTEPMVDAFVRAMASAGKSATRPKAVGLVGPWVPLGPGSHAEPICTELLRPALLAGKIGLPVVAGFADSDASAGGNGAGVAAWPTWQLLRDERLSRVAVHLGGIAHLTFIGGDSAACETLSYDAGPGTCILDGLAERLLDRPLDEKGTAAAEGKPHPEFLHERLAETFFHAAPPKLARPADWGEVYLDRLQLLGRKYRCGPKDLLATATELVARSIAREIQRWTEIPHQVILTGRATRNAHLVQRIRLLLSPSSTIVSDKLDVPAECFGAVVAAMLAAARVDGFPAHVPSAGGADQKVVLGSIWAG